MESNPSGEFTLKNVEEAFDNWNANVIRIPLNQDFWFGYATDIKVDNKQFATKYKTLLSDVVRYAESRNKYIIFDLHWSEKGDIGKLSRTAVDA